MPAARVPLLVVSCLATLGCAPPWPARSSPALASVSELPVWPVSTLADRTDALFIGSELSRAHAIDDAANVTAVQGPAGSQLVCVLGPETAFVTWDDSGSHSGAVVQGEAQGPTHVLAEALGFDSVHVAECAGDADDLWAVVWVRSEAGVVTRIAHWDGARWTHDAATEGTEHRLAVTRAFVWVLDSRGLWRRRREEPSFELVRGATWSPLDAPTLRGVNDEHVELVFRGSYVALLGDDGSSRTTSLDGLSLVTLPEGSAAVPGRGFPVAVRHDPSLRLWVISLDGAGDWGPASSFGFDWAQVLLFEIVEGRAVEVGHASMTSDPLPIELLVTSEGAPLVRSGRTILGLPPSSE